MDGCVDTNSHVCCLAVSQENTLGSWCQQHTTSHGQWLKQVNTIKIQVYNKNIFSDAILQRRRNGRDSVTNHQPLDCLLNGLFRRRLKNPSKLYVSGLCAGNSPVTGEFPAQMASNAEFFSIWWRHHDCKQSLPLTTHTLWLYCQNLFTHTIHSFIWHIIYQPCVRHRGMLSGLS